MQEKQPSSKRFEFAEFSNINTIFDVTPIAKKPGGTRPGYVGKKDSKLYLAKLEYSGYRYETPGTTDEKGIIESFTAQFIRSVWGDNFATDIRLTKIGVDNQLLKIEVDTTPQNLYGLNPITRNPLDDPTNPLCFESKFELPYAIIIPFEVGAATLGPNFYKKGNPENIKKIIQMETIVKLLHVTDHKDDNVIVIDGNCKLIDCAAYFPPSIFSEVDFYSNIFLDRAPNVNTGRVALRDESKNILPDRKEIVKRTLEQFVTFPDEKLDQLLKSYSDYLSEETIHVLRNNISSLQKDVQKKYDINPSLSLNDSQFKQQFFTSLEKPQEVINETKKPPSVPT